MAITYSASTVDITPQNGVGLFGRRGRNGNFATIKSRLEANLILIGENDNSYLLIGLDTLYPSASLKAAIEKELSERKVDPLHKQIMLVATHTHNAPSLDPTKPKLGTLNDAYFQFVVSQITNAVQKLYQTRAKTSRYQYAELPCAAAIYRRRAIWGGSLRPFGFSKKMAMAPNRNVEISDKLQYFCIVDEQEKPAAVIWQWPCHAVFERSSDVISADFPGQLRNFLRKTLGLPNLPVIFFPGFSGDIRPDTGSLPFIHRKKSWLGFGPKFSRRSRHARSRFDAQLTAAVEKVHTMSEVFSFSSLFQSSESELENDDIYETWQGNIQPLQISKMALGGISIVGVSGEVSTAYTPKSSNRTFFTGCVNHSNGYIPTDAQIAEGGYEGGAFFDDFSMQAKFKPSIQDGISRHLSS